LLLEFDFDANERLHDFAFVVAPRNDEIDQPAPPRRLTNGVLLHVLAVTFLLLVECGRGYCRPGRRCFLNAVLVVDAQQFFDEMKIEYNDVDEDDDDAARQRSVYDFSILVTKRLVPKRSFLPYTMSPAIEEEELQQPHDLV
jgi:hypothetical protein